MNTQPLQLPLGVEISEDATFDAFFAGTNGAALSALHDFLNQPQENLFCVWGNKQAGVSHLLQACVHKAIAQQKQALYLPLAEIIHLPTAALDNLEYFDVLAVDDIQVLANNKEWQEAFFNLFNRLRNTGKQLVTGVKNNPLHLDIELPDLKSRLNWGLSFQVFALDDEDSIAALIEKAKRHGLDMNEETAKYIVNHANRHTGQLFDVFHQLDKASLIAQRKLTIPFIKKTMHW